MKARSAILAARAAAGSCLVLLGGWVLGGRRGRDMVATAVRNQIESEQWAEAVAAAYGLDAGESS